MGDNQGQYHTPKGRDDEPGTLQRATKSGKAAAATFIRLIWPLLVKGGAFAKTLPGRAYDLGERIDMPARIAQTRKWVEAQNYPERAEKLRAGSVRAGRATIAATRRAANAAQARSGPIATTVGRKGAAVAQRAGRAIAHRAENIRTALARARAQITNRQMQAATKKAAAKASRAMPVSADGPAPPVPSELMRLLKEEGVAVDGMDVREALPAPVRSSWVGVQGALPLFADEPDPPPVERPISILPAEAQIQPISGSNPQPGSVRAADAATAQSRTAPRWAAFKLLGSALFSSTGSPPFYQNRTFQMTFGATIFLAAAGVAALMLQGGASDLSAAQSSVQSGAMNRAQVEMIVRNYILEHPEIIPEAIDRLQAKRMSSIVDRNRAELEKPFAGGFDGAKDGDVVLVEFFDYACGYCRASLPDIDRLLAQDKSLKVVYRELPILSDESGEAAKASLYAAKQGQYGRFHRALYAAGRPSKESIEAAAKKVGLDPAALASGMSAGDISAEIENNLRLAQSLQATGTPTWVVGDQVLSGAVGYDALKAAIAKARAAQN